MAGDASVAARVWGGGDDAARGPGGCETSVRDRQNVRARLRQVQPAIGDHDTASAKHQRTQDVARPDASPGVHAGARRRDDAAAGGEAVSDHRFPGLLVAQRAVTAGAAPDAEDPARPLSGATRDGDMHRCAGVVLDFLPAHQTVYRQAHRRQDQVRRAQGQTRHAHPHGYLLQAYVDGHVLPAGLGGKSSWRYSNQEYFARRIIPSYLCECLPADDGAAEDVDGSTDTFWDAECRA
eukprot:ctg_452.g220